MRHFLMIVCLCLMPFTVRATQVTAMPLSVLVTGSDHVLVGKVEKVEMVDERGHELLDRQARTGPGLKNELRLHVVIEKDGVLKTNLKKVPAKLVLPLWQMWHFSLGQWKDDGEGKVYIFFLKGQDFLPFSQAEFFHDIRDKQNVERLLRNGARRQAVGVNRSSQATNQPSSSPESRR